MRSKKQFQVGEEIKRSLSNVFLRQDLLSLDGAIISILEVRITPDMRNAKIYFDVFGSKDKLSVEKKLNSISAQIRYNLAKEIELRHVPELHFVVDETQDIAGKVDELISSESKNNKK